MPSGRNILAGLNKLDKDVRLAALVGLRAGAVSYTDALQQTSAHGDITGATRASYIAYAASADESDRGEFDAAYAAAAALNPGQAERNNIGSPGEDELVLVATSGTAYQVDLENDNAGAKAAIGPIHTQQSAAAFDDVIDVLKSVF